ncbi:MAG: FxLYD domain-containing protein [Candidatus Bathyarchaeia archaeon]
MKLIPLLLAFTLAYTTIIADTALAEEVEVVSHSSYLDPFGNFHIVGEVENKGAFSLSSFKVTATFFDASGVTLDQDFAYLMLDILPPGYKAPFHIMYTKPQKAAKIASYALTLNYTQTSKLPPVKLQFESQESFVDEAGWMRIRGLVKNMGEETRFVKIIATCYNESGAVVNVDYSYTDPRDLSPGQTASFEITIPYRANLIKSFALLADSENYVSIDEFQWRGLFAMLITMALSYITLLRVKKKPS